MKLVICNLYFAFKFCKKNIKSNSFICINHAKHFFSSCNADLNMKKNCGSRTSKFRVRVGEETGLAPPITRLRIRGELREG